MGDVEGRETISETAEAPAPVRLACDFCGEEVSAVSRVALDTDYERLRTPHRELYSCEACFQKKERRRLGLDRG